MIPGKIFTGFAKFQGNCQCKWLFGFLSGSKNFCQLLCVSCEVFVLHEYDWIHWVAKSCTTIAYRWLFRDSQFSLRTLWSAVIQSPKFSAQGAAPPLRLLYGALQFWSSDRSRNFGLLRNEYKHCAYPNPHFSWVWALKILHAKNWRVSLCVQELYHPPKFLWILAATPGFQNLTVLDLSRQTTGLRSMMVSFLFVFGNFLLAWVCSWLVSRQTMVSPFYHQHLNLTQALERNQFHFDLLFLESHCHLMLQ